MDEFDKILNQLKDSSGSLKNNLHILEQIIPMEEQMKYFEYSKHIRNEYDHVNRDYLIARLFSPNSNIEDRQFCLVLLASLIDIAAYRSIETFHSSPLDEGLKNWAALALIESRLLIDSDLSGEQQYLVSTGLGGSNNLLRFFSIIPSKDRSDFSTFQKDIIEREFNFALKQANVIIEEFEIKENYTRLQVLSDIKHSLRDMLLIIVKECNDLGDFLDEKFMLTNLRTFEDTEIKKLLHKSNSNLSE